MSTLDQFFREEMKLACELIGNGECWWLIKTINGIPLAHDRRIIFIFSRQQLALYFLGRNTINRPAKWHGKILLKTIRIDTMGLPLIGWVRT